MKNLEKLTPSELCIMRTIWALHGCPATKDIQAAINKEFHKNWSRPTVSTFLKRLREKNYITMKKQGYSIPLVTRQEYLQQTLPRIINSLHINYEEFLFLRKTPTVFLKPLNPQQEHIMLALWDCQKETFTSEELLLQGWNKKKLQNLCQKGYLFQETSKQNQKIQLYKILITRKEYLEYILAPFLDLLNID